MRCIGWGILAVAGVFALGWVVMSLWNWLMPLVFGLKMIGYWEAFGILVLAKILFGGFRHRAWCGGCGHYGGGWRQRRSYWRERMEAKMANMTPEEKEKFKEEMRQKWCCGWDDEKEGSTECC